MPKAFCDACRKPFTSSVDVGGGLVMGSAEELMGLMMDPKRRPSTCPKCGLVFCKPCVRAAGREIGKTEACPKCDVGGSAVTQPRGQPATRSRAGGWLSRENLLLTAGVAGSLYFLFGLLWFFLCESFLHTYIFLGAVGLLAIGLGVSYEIGLLVDTARRDGLPGALRIVSHPSGFVILLCSFWSIAAFEHSYALGIVLSVPLPLIGWTLIRWGNRVNLRSFVQGVFWPSVVGILGGSAALAFGLRGRQSAHLIMDCTACGVVLLFSVLGCSLRFLQKRRVASHL